MSVSPLHLRFLLFSNFAKSILSPSQRVSFLGIVIVSVRMTATVSAERATTIQRSAASSKEGTARPLKAFLKMLGLMAVASPVLQLGRLYTRNGDSGLCISPGPFKGPPLAKARRDLTHSAQKEGCSNKGWGALCEGQTDLRSWSEEESGLHINCLEMLAVCHACQLFLLDIWGHHVLVRSDSRSVVS